MRFIFFSLVIVNLAVFAWGLVMRSNAPQPISQQTSPNLDGYPKVRLLSELPAAPQPIQSDQQNSSQQPLRELVERDRQTDQPLPADQTAQSHAVPGRTLCEMVGPFESEEASASFVERLKAIDVIGVTQGLELPVGRAYWVYLGSQPGRAEALKLLAQLQAKQIDSYIIPKGEKGDMENGISLGMFSKKNLAEARFNQVKALGYSPFLEEVERTQRELWVMLKPGEGEKMSQLSWERVLEGLKLVERRENYCLDIASP